MSKTSSILGLIALIAIGGFIIFGEEKNTDTQPETEQEISVETTENTNIDTEEVSETKESQREEILVTYTSFGFSPNIINIEMGDTVRFSNDSSLNMWVASNPHPQHTEFSDFDAGKNYQNGESYSFTFNESGTYEYHNHSNPSMRGTVVVLGDK